MSTIWNILIVLATIGALVFTVIANVVAFTSGIGWLGWLIGDAILLFVDYMLVKGCINRFFKKNKQNE